MTSYFFSQKYLQYSAPELKQLESTPQLKTLIPKLDELFIKATQLQKEAGDDAANNSYKKSRALMETMAEIRKVVSEYKLTMDESKKNPGLIIAFVTKIKKIIDNYGEKYEEIFNKPRNNNKDDANYLIKRLALAGGLALGFSSGYVLLVAIGVWGVSPLISGSIAHALSLDDNRTATSKLLEETSEILATIQDSIEFEFELKANSNILDSFPLECPITKERIKHPIFCTLDSRLYEKEAIETWFTEHRTAPCNGKVLEENQLPTDVLKDVISLRDAIQALEEEYKAFKLLSNSPDKEQKEQSSSPRP